ncbi:MAG: glycosyltransferase [Clostridia bacterium]|nr:glycosyltransferase [Clostridia bacterium]
MEKYSSKIAVVIPCYNEEKSIGQTIEEHRSKIQGADIYVIDNNSKDNTSKVAEEHGAIVIHEYKQGKGNAIKRAFRDIDAECYFMADGDNTYPADRAQEMIDMVLEGKADMVVGDRLSSTYFTENKRRFHNFGNVLVRKLINMIFNAKVNDIMTGSRAMSYNFVKGFPITSRGFELETEMTIHALDKNYKIEEITVPYQDRDNDNPSKLNTISDGYKVLRTVARLFKEYKPSVFFNLIAFCALVFSICLLVPTLIGYVNTGMVEKFPSLIASGIFLLVALLLWITGIILKVINRKEREIYELIINMK